MKQYFLHDGSKQTGPFVIEDLKSQSITADSMVWTNGMEKWAKASSFPELEAILAVSPPPFNNDEHRGKSDGFSHPISVASVSNSGKSALLAFAIVAIIIAIIYFWPTLATIGSKESQIKIDSVIIDRKDYTQSCFAMERSEYPKISGHTDPKIQDKINSLFQSNYQTFFEKALSSNGCFDGGNSIPASAEATYEVLTNNNNTISIIQTFMEFPAGGGNGCRYTIAVTTANIHTGKIYTKKDFNIPSISTINHSVKKFSKNLDLGSDIPIFYSNEKFKNTNFGIRNDSLMLIIEAHPGAHYTWGTYTIPIDKMK